MKAFSIRTANTSSNGWGVQEEVSHTLDRTVGPAVAVTPVDDPVVANTLGTHSGGQHLEETYCFDPRNVTSRANRTRVEVGLPANTLHSGGLSIAQPMSVRRLTPKECERLQGFPDDYTLVPHKGKPLSDGARYKALGNSMAVPCMRWIGERIQMVEDCLAELNRPENGQRV